MSDASFGEPSLSPDQRSELAALVKSTQARLTAGDDTALDEAVNSAAPEMRAELLRRLLLIELRQRCAAGESLDEKTYLDRFADLGEAVRSAFRESRQSVETLDWEGPPSPSEETASLVRDAFKTETWTDRERRAASESLPAIPGYEVLETIGRGGMGLVFKARHLSLQRFVALKSPLAGVAHDPQELERFFREARASAQLRHDNICPIYDVSEANGLPFMAMAYVEGDNLKDWAAAQPMTARGAAEITAQVARAVGYAHDHDVIHRDIKPSNVMIDRESGKPLLMDFGLAKNTADQDQQLTQTGQVMGTPAYMAPEQAAGRMDLVGKPSDIYALGAVLFELLTGRAPFVGSSGEVIHQLQSSSPPPVRSLAPAVHRDLETICMKAMSREPADRYGSAIELAEDLDRFNAGLAILARREHWVSRNSRWLRRNAAATAVVGLILILSAAAIGYFATGARNASQLAQLTGQFDELLNQSELDAAALERIEALVAQIAESNQQAAGRMRERLHQTYVNHVRTKELGKSRLFSSDASRLEKVIAWLDDRDPDAAKSLREELSARLGAWQVAFMLEAPFSSADEVMGGELRNVLVEPRSIQIAESEQTAWLTNIPSKEYAQLLATFAPTWRLADQVGLILNGRQGESGKYDRGYFFRIRAAEAPDVMLNNTQSCTLEIVRDGVVIRKQTCKVAELAEPDESLHIVATREHERLRLRVGDLPAVEFEDIFPLERQLRGTFGVVSPRGVELTSLVGKEQALPSVVSPLEQGDALFARGQWEEARGMYQAQSTAGDEETRELSRYKEAVCLQRLKRDDEAAGLLESLSESTHRRMRILAACQLWLIRLRKQQYDQADTIFENLSSQYRFEDLAVLIPSADRHAIIKTTFGLSGGINLFRFREEQLRHLERAVAVERLLEEGVISSSMREFQLLRGYHAIGQLERAMEVGERAINDYEWDEAPIDIFVEEQSWMLRQRDRTDEAEKLLRAAIQREPDRYANLRIELARLLQTQGRTDLAQREVQLLLDSPALNRTYHIFAAAHLVAGAIHHLEGRDEDASRMWRAGTFKNFREVSSTHAMITGMELEFALMTLALSGECTAEDLALIIGRSNIGRDGGFLVLLVGQQAHRFAPYVAGMGTRPEVRDEFARIALRDCSIRFHVERPVIHLMMEFSRRGAAPGDWSAEEHDAILEGLLDGMRGYREGQIVETHGAQLFAAWKGITGSFGWSGVSKQLSPNSRAAAAYVFGHRMLRQGKMTEARVFFTSVAQEAAEDSPLKRLAQEQLDQLAP